MANRIIALGFFSLLSALFAADSARSEVLDRIRDSDLRHSDLLLRMVQDPEVIGSVKSRAIEKISILYSQNKKEAERYLPRYAEAVTVLLKHRNAEVREATCQIGQVFASTSASAKFAEAYSNALIAENDADVIRVCAKNLDSYSKDTAIVSGALIAQVNAFLANFRNSTKDESALIQVCKTLGHLKLRKSFIPLLKILQSHYDDGVKSAAQTAIQEIKLH